MVEASYAWYNGSYGDITERVKALLVYEHAHHMRHWKLPDVL